MRASRAARAPGGYALIAAYIITAGLTILSFITFQRSLVELRAASTSNTSQHAFNLAEAAVDLAIRNASGGQTDHIEQTSLSGGTYSATVTPTDTLQYRIVGRGLENAVERYVETEIELTPKSVYQYAVFGDMQVNVSGSAIVDSYNSAVADYEPGNPGQEGDVGTNATSPGGVSVSGSIAINGQVVVGPNVADPESIVVENGGSAVITGQPPIVSAPVAMNMPSVSVPSELTCTDLELEGQTTVVLPPGTYCYDNLSLTGGATLTASGPVKIYLRGELAIGGNSTLGVEEDPTQMLLFAAPASTATLEGTINGTAALYGGLYGPGATLTITGNADVYGSIIAQTVNLSGNAKIHYDEALGELTDPVGLYDTEVLYWREY